MDNSTFRTLHREQTEVPGAKDPAQRISADLNRLARFGANLTDAHSCFVFLKADAYAQLRGEIPRIGSAPTEEMWLAGFHSLSSDLVPHAHIAYGSGLIGWVAKHNRAIHVSPFENDSRTLGTYTVDQQLKSFIGVPVSAGPSAAQKAAGALGVVACDSKKSFAFTKLQGKLLEDLAREVTATYEHLLHFSGDQNPEGAWNAFVRRSEDLAVALGSGAVEVVRLRPQGLPQLEVAVGTGASLTLMEQAYRLIQQSLPPHFPFVRLASGDVLITLDNMMTSFYESRIRAVLEHMSGDSQRISFEFIRPVARDRRKKALSIAEMVRETALASQKESGKVSLGSVVRLEQEAQYGNRRG